MSPAPATRRRRVSRVAALIAAGLLVLFLGLVYAAHIIVRDSFKEEYALFRSVKEGMTEEEVVKLLGEPHWAYSASDAPADYYVEGYARKKRPITNKVFIYIGSEPIAYIWFDHQNRVEDVFVGGS